MLYDVERFQYVCLCVSFACAFSGDTSFNMWRHALCYRQLFPISFMCVFSAITVLNALCGSHWVCTCTWVYCIRPLYWVALVAWGNSRWILASGGWNQGARQIPWGPTHVTFAKASPTLTVALLQSPKHMIIDPCHIFIVSEILTPPESIPLGLSP